MGHLPAKVWRRKAIGFNASEKLAFRRQLAQVAAKNHRTYLSPIVDVIELDVQHEFGTAALAFGAAQCWRG